MTHIAFILFGLYVLIISLVFGVQKSISKTFYSSGERWYFTVVMMVVGFLLMGDLAPNLWFISGGFFLALQAVAADYKWKPVGIVHVASVLISIGSFLIGITIENLTIGIAAILLGGLSYYLLRNVNNSTKWREVAIALIIYISLTLI
jgi:hypothetical protein